MNMLHSCVDISCQVVGNSRVRCLNSPMVRYDYHRQSVRGIDPPLIDISIGVIIAAAVVPIEAAERVKAIVGVAALVFISIVRTYLIADI